MGAGGRVAGGNPGHTVHELQHLLSKCSVKFVVTEPDLLQKARKASHLCDIASNRIFIYEGHDDTATGPQSWQTLLNHGESDWEILDQSKAAATVSAYYSTSGTTGAPKFAAVSHTYQTSNGQYIESETQSKPYQVSRLVSLPLMHAFAAPLVHTAALRCGTPTFIMSRFSVNEFVSTVQRHKITEFPVVPSMLISLVNSSECTAGALRSVREVMCAGAPLSRPVAESFSAVLTTSSARLVQLYGATEAGWISSTPYAYADNYPRTAAITAYHDSESLSGFESSPTLTVGVPLPEFNLRLTDTSSGSIITRSDVPGSLELKTENPFMHYIGAEQATKESFTADGWLMTGDIASRDDQGRYYIVDRQKDMIKVRGWQVAPAEIEETLSSHPHIEDCAVLGVEDSKGSSGEVPWAFIQLKGSCTTDGSTDDLSKASLDEMLLKVWLREKLAGYKIPEVIRAVPKIPRNPAGKILRRLLREQYVPTPSSTTVNKKIAAGRPLHGVSSTGQDITGTVLSSPKLQKEPTGAAPSTGEEKYVEDAGLPSATKAPIASLARYRGSTSLTVAIQNVLDARCYSWLVLLPATLSLGVIAWKSGLLSETRRWFIR